MATASKKKYYKIGDVADRLELPTSTIRTWLKEFKDIKPISSSGGIRLFSDKDVQRFEQIKKLVRIDRFTIEGAKLQLKKNHNSEIIVSEDEKALLLSSTLDNFDNEDNENIDDARLDSITAPVDASETVSDSELTELFNSISSLENEGGDYYNYDTEQIDYTLSSENNLIQAEEPAPLSLDSSIKASIMSDIEAILAITAKYD